MDKKKSLQYNFAFEAIPIIFHSQTTEFMRLLEKDGVEFLKFWWNHVGDQVEESKRVMPAGTGGHSQGGVAKTNADDTGD